MNKWLVHLISVFYVTITIYLAPFCFYYFVVPVKYYIVFYWIVYGSIVFTNMLIILEIIHAIRHNKTKDLIEFKNITENFDHYKSYHHTLCYDDIFYKVKYVPFGIIFSLYLDNEICIMEDTIKHILQCELPYYTTIVFSYNTKKFNKENHDKLNSLIEQYMSEYNMNVPHNNAHCVILYNEKAKSKADNINMGCEYLTKIFYKPHIVALYDADHNPDKHSIIYALHKMYTTDTDILQGRVYIRKPSILIALEFNMIYCVYHEGGQHVRKYAIFGGTNGFWKLDVLDEIKFDVKRLTEDIDASFNALIHGKRIRFNKYVMSSELAPPNLKSLYKQRLRWAQGWSEVTLYRTYQVFLSKCCTFRQKLSTFFFLVWREMYVYIAPHLLAILFASIGHCAKTSCVGLLYYLPTLLIVIMAFIYVIFLYFYECPDVREFNMLYHIYYAFVLIPYEIVKMHITVIGHIRMLLKQNAWNVTSRN